MRGVLVSQEDTTPGIHDTLTEGNYIVHGVVVNIIGQGDGGRLLKNLGHDREVGIKMSSDRLSNIAKGDEDGRLQRISETTARLLQFSGCRCERTRELVHTRMLSMWFIKVSQNG